MLYCELNPRCVLNFLFFRHDIGGGWGIYTLDPKTVIIELIQEIT